MDYFLKKKLGLSQIAWWRQNSFLQIPLVAAPLNQKQLRIGHLCVRRDMLDYKNRENMMEVKSGNVEDCILHYRPSSWLP